MDSSKSRIDDDFGSFGPLTESKGCRAEPDARPEFRRPLQPVSVGVSSRLDSLPRASLYPAWA
jgi:hypothetical protein